MKNFFIVIFLIFVTMSGRAQNWASANEYFPVYTFSDKIMGLTIELDYGTISQNLIVDSIFEKYNKSDSLEYIIYQPVESCLPIDTNGLFRFFRNISLENNLLNGLNRTFYVYCTKGIVQRKIKDVVFSLSECISNVVVFRFEKIDTNKYGYPILCMKTKLPVQFDRFENISKKIELEKDNNKVDYTDSVKSVVFAKSDSLYFGYSDTFNWNDLIEHENSSLFPERFIILKGRNENLEPKWGLSLDLFGIPCD